MLAHPSFAKTTEIWIKPKRSRRDTESQREDWLLISEHLLSAETKLGAGT